ncbi:MAG: hypothetical protein R3F43_32895 [bacterium]
MSDSIQASPAGHVIFVYGTLRRGGPTTASSPGRRRWTRADAAALHPGRPGRVAGDGRGRPDGDRGRALPGRRCAARAALDAFGHPEVYRRTPVLLEEAAWPRPGSCAPTWRPAGPPSPGRLAPPRPGCAPAPVPE